jgi:hypothetical protein
LMAVRVFKDRVDILNKASWSRVLSRHNPILYRVIHSFQLAAFQMCPDFRFSACF